MSEDEYEDLQYQQVVLLDPPPTTNSLTVTLPDGTEFRPVMLLVCPLCRGDYLLGKSELLRTKYLGMERMVAVCPTCADEPPKNYGRKLRIALGRFPWSEEGRVESLDEHDSEINLK